MFSLPFFRRAGLWSLLGPGLGLVLGLGVGCSGMERADSFCPSLRVVEQASVLKTTEASFEIVRTDGTCVLDEGLLTVDFTIQLEIRPSVVSSENVSVPLFVAVADAEDEVIHRKWRSPVSVEPVPVGTRRTGDQAEGQVRFMQHRVKMRWLLGPEEKPSQFAFYMGFLEPDLN